MKPNNQVTTRRHHLRNPAQTSSQLISRVTMGILVIASPFVPQSGCHQTTSPRLAPWQFLCCSSLHQKEEVSSFTCVWLSLSFLEACSKHILKSRVHRKMLMLKSNVTFYLTQNGDLLDSSRNSAVLYNRARSYLALSLLIPSSLSVLIQWVS